ncbi:MAG: hypothetical protein JWR69_3418, partial [Pedosphaera sp.]|nr:hypothetical protein [Pedosphaera sp.]
MKKSTLLKFASLLGAIAVPSVRAQTVNFHDALNGQGTGYATSGAFGLLYYGQGAYKDTGNNIWNGF